MQPYVESVMFQTGGLVVCILDQALWEESQIQLEESAENSNGEFFMEFKVYVQQ